MLIGAIYRDSFQSRWSKRRAPGDWPGNGRSMSLPEAARRGIETAPKTFRKLPKRLYCRMLGQPIAFGSFLLRPDTGTLVRDGELVALGQRGALLLGALLKAPGEVRTKAELMDAAWPGLFVEESNLSVQIAALRKLLGPSPDGGEWIATIPRVGYCFVGEPSSALSAQPHQRHRLPSGGQPGGRPIPTAPGRS